ncbi:hypothetical protein [Thioclava sp. GXIMD4216]|uniref:hypothetical protein n=1 Tax=Thioclava sp. GXIMD4216 TaxID=3131929 RepID=UPI0030D43233
MIRQKPLEEVLEQNRAYFDLYRDAGFEKDRSRVSQLFSEARPTYQTVAHPQIEPEFIARIAPLGARGVDLLAACLQVPEFARLVRFGIDPRDDRQWCSADKELRALAPFLDRMVSALQRTPEQSLNDMLSAVFSWTPVEMVKPDDTMPLWALQREFIELFPANGAPLLGQFYHMYLQDGQQECSGELHWRAEVIAFADWCQRIELNHYHWPSQWVLQQWRFKFISKCVETELGPVESGETPSLWFELAENIGFEAAEQVLHYIKEDRSDLLLNNKMAFNTPLRLKSGTARQYALLLKRAELAFGLDPQVERGLALARLIIGTPTVEDLQAARIVPAARNPQTMPPLENRAADDGSNQTSLKPTDLLIILLMLAVVCGTLYGIVAMVAKVILASIMA